MKLKLLSLLAATALLLSACEKDFSEENGDLPISNNGSGSGGSGGGTGGSGSIAGCKDCIYVPRCDGSVYKYIDTAAGSVTQRNYTLQFVKDTTIDSQVYQKFLGEGGNTPTYYNCTSGVSTSIIYNGASQGGTVLPYVKLTLLKANEPVGATWTSNFTDPTSGLVIINTFNIVAKDITRNVNGVNYNNVIHLHMVQSAVVPGLGNQILTQNDYYIAKGIGNIESISFESFGGTQILHSILVSAVIP